MYILVDGGVRGGVLGLRGSAGPSPVELAAHRGGHDVVHGGADQFVGPAQRDVVGHARADREEELEASHARIASAHGQARVGRREHLADAAARRVARAELAEDAERAVVEGRARAVDRVELSLPGSRSGP